MLGVLFDLYRLPQRKLKIRNLVISNLSDLIYCISAIVLLFSLLLVCNFGQWRLPIVVIVCFGAFCYFQFLRQSTIMIIERFYRTLYLMLRFCFQKIIFNLLIKPFLCIYKLVKYTLQKIFYISLGIFTVIFYRPLSCLLFRPTRFLWQKYGHKPASYIKKYWQQMFSKKEK